MSELQTNLARNLKTALAQANVTVDALADRTKVPRTTILHLMNEPVEAILPERVYLRGHLGVLVREVGADVAHFEALFDEAFPLAQDEDEAPEQRRFRSQSMAVSATLGGVALLSVIAAFVSALD